MNAHKLITILFILVTLLAIPASAFIIKGGFGSSSLGSITGRAVASSLTITPSFAQLAVGERLTLTASSGIPPYTFSFAPGAPGQGTLSFFTETAVFYSSAFPISKPDMIRVTDSVGAFADAEIYVGQTLQGPASATPGQQVIFKITGFQPASSVTVLLNGQQLGPQALTDSKGTVNPTYTIPLTATSGTVTATGIDSKGSSTSVSYSITILSTSPLTITTTSPLPSGTVGTLYSAQLSASGGIQPYTWSVGKFSILPLGLSLDPITGVISGMPQQAGTYTFTIRVTDANGNIAEKQFSLTINPQPVPLVITTTSLPIGTVGTAYDTTVEAIGGTTPYKSWLVTGLPFPLIATQQINRINSVVEISGTPTSSGSFPVSVTVTDALGAVAKAALTLVINPAQPSLVPAAEIKVITQSETIAVGSRTTLLGKSDDLSPETSAIDVNFKVSTNQQGRLRVTLDGQIIYDDQIVDERTLPLSLIAGPVHQVVAEYTPANGNTITKTTYFDAITRMDDIAGLLSLFGFSNLQKGIAPNGRIFAFTDSNQFGSGAPTTVAYIDSFFGKNGFGPSTPVGSGHWLDCTVNWKNPDDNNPEIDSSITFHFRCTDSQGNSRDTQSCTISEGAGSSFKPESPCKDPCNTNLCKNGYHPVAGSLADDGIKGIASSNNCELCNENERSQKIVDKGTLASIDTSQSDGLCIGTC